MTFFSLGNTGEYTAYELLNLPNSRLKVKRTGEYCSSCPKCGGEDRFIFWPEVGNYYCRRCDLKGFIVDAPQPKEKTLHDIVGSKITSQTLECNSWVEYFTTLQESPLGQSYWRDALGENYQLAVNQFGLGFCPNYLGLGPTVTIPVGYNNKIYVVRHRILNPAGARYLVEPAGVGGLIFNLDESLTSDKVVLVEGEKKALRLWLEGYVAITSTTGTTFEERFDLFLMDKEVYVIYDPDTAGQKAAEAVIARVGGTNIVLSEKVDDLLNKGFDIRTVLGEPWRERCE